MGNLLIKLFTDACYPVRMYALYAFRLRALCFHIRITRARSLGFRFPYPDRENAYSAYMRTEVVYGVKFLCF